MTGAAITEGTKMDGHLTVVTPPATGLVDLETAKKHLRVDHDDDDALITAQIAAVSSWLTTFISKTLVDASYLWALPRFPVGGLSLWLPRPPVTAITEVAYTDPDGVDQVLDPAEYSLQADRYLVLTEAGGSWPETSRVLYDSVRISYAAGYGTAADLPAEIQPAALLLLGVLYEERAQEFAGPNLQRIEFSAGQLVGNLRESLL